MKKLLLLSLLSLNANAAMYVNSTAHELTQKVHQAACETGQHDFTIVNESNNTAYYVMEYFTEMPLEQVKHQSKDVWLAPGVIYTQHFTSNACHPYRQYGDYRTTVYSIAHGNGQIVTHTDSAWVHVIK